MVSRSYTSGSGNKSLWHITLPDLLDQRANEDPDKDIHVFWTAQSEETLLRESISYRDLAERSYNVAASLLNLGLEPGDRIAIAANSCPEWLLLEYAALR
jgi:acyl-CoA synthetase (AMP-forming)/AMP-acid ligase II